MKPHLKTLFFAFVGSIAGLAAEHFVEPLLAQFPGLFPPNTAYMGPASGGSSGLPSARALVSADFPSNAQLLGNVTVGSVLASPLSAFGLDVTQTFDPTANDSAALQVASIGKFSTGTGSPFTNAWGQFIAPAFDANGNTVVLTTGGGLRILNTSNATVSGSFSMTNQYGLRVDALSGASAVNQAIWTVGPSTAGLGTGTAQANLHINDNAVQNTAPINIGSTYTGLYMSAADGHRSIINLDSWGSNAFTNPFLEGRYARTTALSPTAVQAGDELFGITAQGYGTSGYMSGTSAISFWALDTFQTSPAHAGQYVTISTVPAGTNSSAEAIRVQGSGGVSVGTTTDGGIGTVIGKNGIGTIPTIVSSLPTCNSGSEGQHAYVTDQNTGVAYRGAVTGSGSTHQAVVCSAGSWLQD